jgi:hypothetical protein
MTLAFSTEELGFVAQDMGAEVTLANAETVCQERGG